MPYARCCHHHLGSPQSPDQADCMVVDLCWLPMRGEEYGRGRAAGGKSAHHYVAQRDMRCPGILEAGLRRHDSAQTHAKPQRLQRHSCEAGTGGMTRQQDHLPTSAGLLQVPIMLAPLRLGLGNAWRLHTADLWLWRGPVPASPPSCGWRSGGLQTSFSGVGQMRVMV